MKSIRSLMAFLQGFASALSVTDKTEGLLLWVIWTTGDHSALPARLWMGPVPQEDCPDHGQEAEVSGSES